MIYLNKGKQKKGLKKVKKVTKEENNLELSAVRGVKAYERSRAKAEEISQNPDMLEKLLENLEKYLEKIPVLGSWLAPVPVLIEMVRSYVKGEYPQLPISTLIGIVTALVYFISPLDLIPDTIPGIGHVDDAMVIAVTMAFVAADVETYKQWREVNKE